MAKRINKCPACGAGLGEDTKVCPYCDAVFSSEKDTIKNIKDAISNDVKSWTETVQEQNKNPQLYGNFNNFIFIILLICCWPIALLYLGLNIYKNSKNKNNK